MKIEIFYFEDCPSYKKAEDLINTTLEEIGQEATVVLKRIEDDREAQEHKFLGSPTIRIDGTDIEPAAATSVDYGIKCRIYETKSGMRGWPEKATVISAINKAAQ